MRFQFKDIETATSISPPSTEELAAFECYAKNQVEKGDYLLDAVICKNPTRLNFLFSGLLGDQPRAAFKVASRHLEFLDVGVPKPLGQMRSECRDSLEKPSHPSHIPAIDQVREEDLLLLQAIPVLKATPYSLVSREKK